jgi:hypothetical protein
MNWLMTPLRRVTAFLLSRTLFLALGAGAGYAYGYHRADPRAPSLYSRVQSLIGADKVRDDHTRRQQAIEAIRQSRADSIEALLPH